MSTQVLPEFSEVMPKIKRSKAKEMLVVREINGITEVRINSSSLGIILSCPRKSYYILHRKLKSSSESPALLFGTAIHKALEVFYSHPKAARTIPIKFKEHSDLMAFGTPAPTDHFLYAAIKAFVDTAEPLACLPGTDKRSIPNGIYILQNYFQTYINDPYEVYCDENGPVTERTGEIILHEEPGLRIILFGTIDVILKNLADQRALPTDHKTTSIVGSDFFNRLKPNHQYTGYLLIAQRALNLPTNEFLVNALQVKAKPLTTRGSAPNFTRQTTSRSELDIAEFTQSVIYAVKSYLDWMRTNTWPIGHVDACTMYGGCQFLEVCSAPSQLRENLLAAKFSNGEEANG